MSADDETILESIDDLYAWREDEGALDDSQLLSVNPDTATVVIGLAKPPPKSDDPRERFRRETCDHTTFVLVGEGDVSFVVDGEPKLPSPTEAAPVVPPEGDSGPFGLELNVKGGSHIVVARRWKITMGETVAVPVERFIDPYEVTCHGPGPFSARDIMAGVPGKLEHNWNGSGQSFGAAFIRDVHAPRPVAPDETVSGAWRVEPDIWLIGQSSHGYISLQRTDDSPNDVVARLLRNLTKISEWVSSGNSLLENDDHMQQWLDSR